MFRRHAKPLLLLAATAVALLLTVSRHGRMSKVGLAQTPLAAAAESYDLGALRVFNLSLHRVQENYVDPTRLEPRRMLLAALDYVQRGVAEVMVDARDDGRSITVRVDDSKADFDLSHVDSPWALSGKLKEVFRFIQQHVHTSTEVRDIEYDAVSGVLSTLDPHSQLLKPELYNEMKLQTRGEFGGLGIVIGIRRGQLTIIKPIDDTPASRAGLKAGDRIVKINEESTVNITLSEAVSRLRGAPGTKVTVWTERPPATAARKNVLVRDRIEIQSVKARLLKGDVGYVSIDNFQGNSEDHLLDGLTKLRQQGARAFILDLRGNPGGLLDQAVKIADIFVSHGTIVTTVGLGGKQREPKRAHADGDEFEDLPLVVLVNEGSASASEIVAGAMRQLDRAVVMGRQTFGKGTVQVLYDNDDGSALKLTIAQYLTPGDVSIQQVGVTPDIVLQPVWITKGKPVHLYARAHRAMREEDLEEGVPLGQEGVRSTDRATETAYYLEAPPKWWGVEEEEEDPEETQDPEPELEPGEDPETRFARDFLVAVQPAGRRSEALRGAQDFFARRLVEENARIEKALGELGVDWTVAAIPTGATPRALQASARVQGARVEAGQRATFTLEVQNDGSAPASRVRAVTHSPNALFDERELVVGRIAPGEKKVVELPVQVPRDALGRVDPVTFEVLSQGSASVTAETRVEIAGLPRPLFAYGYQIVDDLAGNGDGLLQKGERVRLRVDVRNVGRGKAFKVWTTLRNLSGPGVFIHKGRFKLGDLLPDGGGESPPVAGKEAVAVGASLARSAEFDFEVRPDYEGNDCGVELTVYDAILHDYVSEKLKIPLAAKSETVERVAGTVRLGGDTVAVRAGANAESSVIGRLVGGGAVPLAARVGGTWVRVDLEGRPGFVEANLTQATQGPAKFRFTPELQITPPILQIEPGLRATVESEVVLKGTATDDHKISDLYIVVANQTAKMEAKKVFYVSNQQGQDPRRLAFAAKVPLWPGQNHITVVARENDDVLSRETVIVMREGGTVAAVSH